jgi:hypothetical protein
MLKGLQTHFNAPVDTGLLRELAARGVQMCRMDCQHVDGQPLSQMVDDVISCGLAPLIVLDNERQLASLPAGVYAELLNEPDIAGMPTAEYKSRLAVFADAALARGITPCGPVISNMNQRAFKYLDGVVTLPAGVLCSVHRYPPGTSWPEPHTGFSRREGEVERLRTTVGSTRPFGISEFGYNSHDQSDEQALQNIRGEFAFWEKQGAAYACLYQLNDGVEDTVMNRYGVRRADGSWKPQIEAFSTGE